MKCEKMLSSPLLLIFPQMHFTDNPPVYIVLLKTQTKPTRLPRRMFILQFTPGIGSTFEMPAFQQCCSVC